MKPTPNDAHPPIRSLKSHISWQCPWYHIRTHTTGLPDGSQGEYHVVNHSGAAFIVPLTPQGEIVLIRIYRFTVGAWCWEIPAGGIENDLSPQATAHKELREEIGGIADHMHTLGTFYLTTGITNAVGHIYLATGVTLQAPNHEPAEILTIHSLPAAEALQMARDGRIQSGPSALALLRCAPLINEIISGTPNETQ